MQFKFTKRCSSSARFRSARRVATRARTMSNDEVVETIVPSPTVAALERCKTSAWMQAFKALAFRSIEVAVPEEFIRYALADGVVATESNRAMPQREEVDAFDAAEDLEKFTLGDGDEDEEAEATAASFPAFERDVSAAIEALGGECAPKFTWSAPKDAVWVSAGNTMKCRNVDEVILLLKASDSVAHDLTDAYGACCDYEENAIANESEEERAIRENPSPVLTLREWFDLNPSMEFRCFVRKGLFIAISQRHVNDFFEFLVDDAVRKSIEFALETFWHAHVESSDWHAEMQDYVFDVYVTPKTKKVKLVDFNVWGGTTLPLLFDWQELEELASRIAAGIADVDDDEGDDGDDCCCSIDGIEFRVINQQEHIRPGLQLGVPFDLYDTTPGGAIAEFLQEQKRKQDQA